MADHGTVAAQPVTAAVAATGYTIAGTAPSGPTVPTTGQVWPRGNP